MKTRKSALVKIAVGSLNEAKISAVEETLKQYPHLFGKYKVTGFNSKSGVSHQPRSLEETVHGAYHRATSVQAHGDIGIGIESGLFEIPGMKGIGTFDLCACVIYDGKKYGTGLSSAFMIPPKLKELIDQENIGLATAAIKAGMSTNKNLATEEGVIGILTNCNVDRMMYSMQAVHMALIRFNHPGLYPQVTIGGR